VFAALHVLETVDMDAANMLQVLLFLRGVACTGDAERQMLVALDAPARMAAIYLSDHLSLHVSETSVSRGIAPRLTPLAQALSLVMRSCAPSSPSLVHLDLATASPDPVAAASTSASTSASSAVPSTLDVHTVPTARLERASSSAEAVGGARGVLQGLSADLGGNTGLHAEMLERDPDVVLPLLRHLCHANVERSKAVLNFAKERLRRTCLGGSSIGYVAAACRLMRALLTVRDDLQGVRLREFEGVAYVVQVGKSVAQSRRVADARILALLAEVMLAVAASSKEGLAVVFEFRFDWEEWLEIYEAFTPRSRWSWRSRASRFTGQFGQSLSDGST
jgi:hypothetical protein